ncbi:MAG: NAD(P)H-dependent oxidoreductase [Saprospiraceae bacterium]
MILVIHGTNRTASQSKPVSDYVQNYLTGKYKGEVKLLDLATIPMTAFESSNMYHSDQLSTAIINIQTELMIPATKIVFISPEYNGSIPGILKLFIDACSVSDAKASFYHKKALLIGIASGRAGNLRGMDHLSSILMYMNMVVYPNKLPISRIETLIDENNTLSDLGTIHILTSLLNEFLEF